MKNKIKTDYIRQPRKSDFIYENKYYKDGKPRIVMLIENDAVIFEDQPYGYRKNRQMKKIKV